MEKRFLVTLGDKAPVIMCEKHAKLFEKVMMTLDKPHTIYEMDDEDEVKKCHACNLQGDIVDSMPRIILPN